jgi:hypothetical protein
MVAREQSCLRVENHRRETIKVTDRQLVRKVFDQKPRSPRYLRGCQQRLTLLLDQISDLWWLGSRCLQERMSNSGLARDWNQERLEEPQLERLDRHRHRHPEDERRLARGGCGRGVQGGDLSLRQTARHREDGKAAIETARGGMERATLWVGETPQGRLDGVQAAQ